MPKNTSLALRLLKEREAKLSALRAALVEGEDSGPSTAFDFDRFIARKRKAESSATIEGCCGPRPRAQKNPPHFLVISPRCG